MSQVEASENDVVRHIKTHAHKMLNLNHERTIFLGQTLPHEKTKRSKLYPKRRREENSRGLIDAKKQKSEQDFDNRREIALKSAAAKRINSSSRVEEPQDKSNKSTLKSFQAYVCAPLPSPYNKIITDRQRVNRTLSDEHQRRYDAYHRQYIRGEFREKNGSNDHKHSEDRMVYLQHDPRRFDGSLARYQKDKLGRSIIDDNNGNIASHVGLECMKAGVGSIHDVTIHQKLSREISRRGNIRVDRRLKSYLNTNNSLGAISDEITEKRSTFRVQESENGGKQTSRNTDYLDSCFVKENLEQSSQEGRKNGRCAMVDLLQINCQNASATTNIWNVKRTFSSKIIIPNIKSEEVDCSDVSTSYRDNLLWKDDQDEGLQKKSKFLADDGSQRSIEPGKKIKAESSRTREVENKTLEGVEAKQEIYRADSVQSSDLTMMQQNKSKLVMMTKQTNFEGSNKREEISAKFCNIKEEQTSKKLRDIKSKLQGKDGNRHILGGKAQAVSKENGLKTSRPKDTIPRKSPEIYLSKITKGGKIRTVKSKESLMRRRALKVVGAKDDGDQHLYSYEPKHHKHKDRTHFVSPKLRNPTSQKKEHVKSMSPQRSRTDLSDWKKLERERKNTLAAFDSRYRRFGGGTSGLGGYSPRRRRSEAAIKTPSPPSRSPERRKPRAWDLPPSGMDKSMIAAISLAQQATASLASVTPLVSSSVLLSLGATSTTVSCGLTPAPTMIPTPLQQVNPAVTAVTLTQATRLSRRLYIGNVPATVSDGELLEFMNAAMISANANHLAGTKPCISCSVNVEKSYAFAEFITPEDATAALAFDGVTLHGITLKIRRPKDFVQPTNVRAENISSILDMVSNIVPDSPHKVFVGGISSSLTAHKVKEIVTAFGQLKAYHWEVDKTKQPPQAYAFLEYMDPAATLKACAGLNGMRLGTRFLTVVQTTLDAKTKATSKKTPSYDVPEHAKTLLQASSRVLELQNLMTADEMRLVSKQELDEIIEDVHLECSRFGNIKSMHIIQLQSSTYSGKERGTISNNMERNDDPNYEKKLSNKVVYLGHVGVISKPTEAFAQTSSVDGSYNENQRSSLAIHSSSYYEKITEKNQNKSPVHLYSNQTTTICWKEKNIGISCNMCRNISRTQAQNTLNGNEDHGSEGLHIMTKTPIEVMEICGGDASLESVEQTHIHPIKQDSDVYPREVDCLNTGKIYIEFSREESACQAAHYLHGHTFMGRKIIVSYFSLKTYQKKFHKGLRPRTYEEKQALALVVQGHLTAHIKD